MSLTDDIQKLMDFVVSETRRFITKNNGGQEPSPDEILLKGESHEFPEISTGRTSQTYFVWDEKHVMLFTTTWEPTTKIESMELTEDQWPLPLKLRLATSVELKTPDGQTHKIQ